MKDKRAPGKISDHFQGLGAADIDSVTQRAREIALTNGRPPNFFTQDDFLQAKRELQGDTATEDPEDVPGLQRWDEPPTASGVPAERAEAPDEQTVAEDLIAQGMNEAEHEHMVEGSKLHNT